MFPAGWQNTWQPTSCWKPRRTRWIWTNRWDKTSAKATSYQSLKLSNCRS